MPLNKSVGNMYPWATHTHTHLRGACRHECPYCYVQRGRAARYYKGPLRLEEKELRVAYGSGKTIFLEHCTDLFAEGIPFDWIDRILHHAASWPGNTYVLQTKNPMGMERWMWIKILDYFHVILGTTIETNRETPGKAPQAKERASWMCKIRERNPSPVFVTVEPIMDFDLDEFSDMLIGIRPAFVNIGADSKGCGFPEPGKVKILTLIDKLRNVGIEVRQKENLGRLLT